MPFCRKCGNELPAGATKCPLDGAEVSGVSSEPTVALQDADLEPLAVLQRAADLLPGAQVGGYVIDAKIGQGGMGVVYGAHHPRIGKKVAIKILSPLFCGDPVTVERFEQEARLVNDIGHPNIVDVFQFGELPDGRSFFVMEWLDGEGLGERLMKGPLPVPESVEILDVVADALEAAHDKGVIHRDLKSDNVFLVKERSGRKVKLLDFGLAKLAHRGEDGGAIVKTQTGMLMGTPAYMSPEQARGKNVDHRTDIYALGCLAYKMLTGKLPFTADNAMDVLVQQLNQPPPAPARVVSGIPESLSQVVELLMSKSPNDRPSLKQLRAVLADVRTGRDEPRSRRFTPDLPMPGDRPERTKKRSGNGLAWALVVVLLLGAGGAFAWVKLRHGNSEVAAADPAAAAAPAAAPDPAPAPEPAPAPAAGAPAPAATPPVVEPIAPEAPAAAPAPAATPVPTPTPPKKKRRLVDDEEYDPLTDPDRRPAPPAPSEPPPMGAVLIQLDQPEAQIEIDGRVVSQGKGGRFELPPGNHVLVVSAPNRRPVKRDLEIEPGRTVTIRIGEQPIPAEEPPKEPPPQNEGSPPPSQ